MKYNHILELWGSVLVENELGELTKDFQKIKNIYCEIRPQHGGVGEVGNSGISESYTIQRIFVRKKSIKDPKVDMYFVDRNGWKYEILDFFPHYQNNAELEFRTRINYG